MGDFDRNAKPAEGAQTKKLIMTAVLGAVLVGVVAMQMLKGGPTAAEASTGQPPRTNSGGEQPQVVDDSPEALRAALLKDPTPSLLVAGPRTPTIAPSEQNPFAMSRAWRQSISPKEPVPEPVQHVPVVQPEPTIVTPPAPEPVALKAADYKLSMILVSNGQLIALVNGSTVSAGSKLRDAVVVEVRSDAIVLRPKDFPEGPTLELSLKPN
jgi:hypothetical protein